MRVTLLTLTWTTLAEEDSFDFGATRKARLLGGRKQKARLTESGMALLFRWRLGRWTSDIAHGAGREGRISEEENEQEQSRGITKTFTIVMIHRAWMLGAGSAVLAGC